MKNIRLGDFSYVVLIFIGLLYFTQCSSENRSTSPKDFIYELNELNTGIIINGYIGRGGILIIPSEINGKPVVELGPRAFEEHFIDKEMKRQRLSSVYIPDSVKKLGNDLFSACRALINVRLPNEISIIPAGIFYYCDKLTSINIPNGVTKIDWAAFSHCLSIIEVNIPNGVTEIGVQAFSTCVKLTKIEIPDSVILIDNAAFANCESLTDIVLETRKINFHNGGRHTFTNCPMLNLTTRQTLRDLGYQGLF